MNHYADYILEREGAEYIENDFGFITYKCSKEECFIEDMYIIPEHRSTGRGHTLLSLLEHSLMHRNIKYVTCRVWTNVKGATDTVAKSLTVGFHIIHAAENVIYLKKNLGE